MQIRQEESKDYSTVETLIQTAFQGAEHTDGAEHELVARLRKSPAFVQELSLVAEENAEIIGHILFTKLRIGDIVGLALAPLSVLPGFQRKGIGSALIQKGHEIAKDLGYDIVVVLGSEKYYPKFGYRPANFFGIKPPFDVPDENFMALSLSGKTERMNASVEYAKEFFEK